MSDGLHVIAEAGTNHGGSLERAKHLVDIAVEARADSVKFQIIYPEGLYLPYLRIDGVLTENEVVRLRREGMLSDDDYRVLATYARERGIDFSASVFDERGVRLLDELDVPYIKLASCDLNHDRLIERAAATGRRLILSTGMADNEEIAHAVRTVDRCGAGDRLVLLHCVSIYPCPTSAAAVHRVQWLHEQFGRPVGFSDHTERSVAAAMAITAGASWIEKHFTHDRSAQGFDHAYAMEPADLAAFIGDVRDAAALRGERGPVPHPREIELRVRARRGLFAARSLSTGEVLTEADILIVRPAGALAPNDAADLLGRPLSRDLPAFSPLARESVLLSEASSAAV